MPENGSRTTTHGLVAQIRRYMAKILTHSSMDAVLKSARVRFRSLCSRGQVVIRLRGARMRSPRRLSLESCSTRLESPISVASTGNAAACTSPEP